MKTRTQKIISLVLVLVMLVTMIPAGIFSANAAVSAELTAALADYENATEFVINSVEDWKAFSAVSKNFAKKIVKLGADIDAQGETLPQLFTAQNPEATFDGQGYTIKNVGTAEAPNETALLSFKSCLNIQNLNVDNVHVSGSGDTAVIVDWQNAWGTYTIKNIKVTNSSAISSDKAAGIIIGQISGNAKGALVNLENIIVSGCSAQGVSNGGGWSSTGVAALAGYTVFNNGDKGVTAKNIEVVGSTFTDTTEASNVAGLFGYFRHNGATALTIENAYVNATFKTPNSSGWKGVAAGIFQTANTSVNATNTVKNVITNNVYPGIVQFPTLFYAQVATYEVENLYAVQRHDPAKDGWVTSGAPTINGVAGCANGYAAIPATAADATVIPYMITRNADGFITSVHAPAGLGYDLLNYDSVSTFVINSVEDWKLVAAKGATASFNRKTIKLGCDIDAKGETLPTLLTATRANGGFSATFDGQGYTIKNANVTGALFGNVMYSWGEIGVANRYTGSVSNVNLDHITVTGDTNVAFIAKELSAASAGGHSFVNNVRITNSSVTATTGIAGGIYGSVTHHSSSGGDIMNISSIYMSDTVTIQGATHAGGLVGNTYWNGGEANISKIETYATVKTTTAAVNYVGGLVGNGAHLFTTGNGITVNDCIIGGSLEDVNDVDQGAIGAIFGYVAAGGTKDYKMTNIIITSSYVTKDRWKVQLGVFAGAPVLVAKGIASLYGHTSAPWSFVGTAGSMTINGITKSGGELQSYNRAGCQILKITASQVEAMVKRNDAGFIEKVYDGIAPNAVQYSAVSNGTYAVRFLAMSQLAEATNVNMVVTAYVKDAEGNVIQKLKFDSAKAHYIADGVEKKGCMLYDTLTVYGDKGIKEYATAEKYGAAKLAGFTIYGIPAGNAVTFEVTTSYDYYTGELTGVTGTVTLSETSVHTMTVNFDANGALIK